MSEAITTGEASRILRVSEATTRALERSGKLPAIKTSSGFRVFDRRAVEKLAAERGRRTS